MLKGFIARLQLPMHLNGAHKYICMVYTVPDNSPRYSPFAENYGVIGHHR